MFSELGALDGENGLAFSDEHTALYGSINGFGLTVTDIGDNYVADIFCDMDQARERELCGSIAASISALGEGLPKNTMLSQSCEWGFVRITLDKYCLLQENIVYIPEFLDKLAVKLGELGITGCEYRFFAPDKPVEAPAPAPGVRRVKLGFDIHSVIGLFGAVIGALAMVVIAILTVDADFEINTLELRFEISTYILSGVTAIVIFADYRFIARKLDACGVIACSLLTPTAVVLSGLGVGVRACSKFAGVSFMQALRDYPQYLERFDSVGSFMFGYITRGLVLAVLACVVIYVFYFTRHPEETVRSVRDEPSKPGGKP